MPKVRAHTRKLASGKVVQVREHMVSGVRGYHHPDTRKRAANAKDQKKFHENEAEKHRKRYAYLQGQLSPLSGKEYSQAERDRIENAANWHYYQSEAHSARAYQMRGDLSDTGKVLARDGVKHSEKYAAKPPTGKEGKKAMSINSNTSPGTLEVLKSKIARDAELLEKSRVKAHTRTMQSGKKVIVREHVDSRTKSPKEEANNKKKWYVGVKGSKRVTFQSAGKPTQESHGKQYNAIIGPFTTLRGAKYSAKHGANNPHLQSVADAERLARQETQVGSGKAKTYSVQHNVGHAKYLVSFHDGKKTHEDGSPFSDIKIFKNKVKLENFLKELRGKGYKEAGFDGKSMPIMDLLKSKIAEDAETLQKGVKFKKTVKEMRAALEAKIERLQLELAEEAGAHRERLIRVREAIEARKKERAEAGDEMPTPEEGTAMESAPDLPDESWKMRSIQRKLSRYSTMLRNLKPGDIIELDEHELADYGF